MLSPGTQQAEEKQLKTNPSPLLLAIPATCDFTGSTLMFIALTMVPASTYQMMRGFINVITPLLSVIFLKAKLHRHHWTAVAMILLGVAEVGFVAVHYSGDDGSEGLVGSVGVGIVLILIAQLFTGTMFIVEEKLLGDYYLDPMKAVGLEGMWGLSYYMLLLPIMQAIKCTNSLCNFGYLENSSYAFAQMADNGVIIWESIGMMASIACFNVCGITVTKIATAGQRATIDTSRTLIIWACSCLFLGEAFHWEAIFGFALLVLGTLMYNEIMVVPCLGFDQNTKEKKQERAAKDKRDAEYTTMTSPAAPYNTASRNKRLLNKQTDQHYDNVGEGEHDEYHMDER